MPAKSKFVLGSRYGRTKPNSRILAVTCQSCGYKVRVSRNWLAVGLPTCCCGGSFAVDRPELNNYNAPIYGLAALPEAVQAELKKREVK